MYATWRRAVALGSGFFAQPLPGAEQVSLWLASMVVGRRFRCRLAFLVGLGLHAGAGGSQDQSVLGSEQSVRELEIPLADGVATSAVMWTPPPGGGPQQEVDRWPIILLRTPYGEPGPRSSSPGAGRLTAEMQGWLVRGWAVVQQHVRGTGRSAGSFQFLFQESTDGAATIEWLAGQPFSDGRVAMAGASYEGSVQWLAASAAPQALRCITPTASFGASPFQQSPYVGGAFHLAWAVDWLPTVAGVKGLGRDQIEKALRMRPLLRADEALGGPLRWWRLLLSHPSRDGFWQPLLEVSDGAPRFGGQVLTISGWFDGDLAGALAFWRRRAAADPSLSNRLLIGPWNHQETWLGGDARQGVLSFPAAAEVEVTRARTEFLATCLEGLPQPGSAVQVYLSGANQWIAGDDYPPAKTRVVPWLLDGDAPANTASGGGRLVLARPGNLEPPPSGHAESITALQLDGSASSLSGAGTLDRFSYDPRDPVPSSAAGEVRWRQEARDDVLVYSTEILREDVAVLGPVRLVVFVATDAPDTDLVARLVDVLPDGRPIGLRHTQGVLRLRYRDGFAQPRLLEPNEPVEVTIELGDFGHVFRVGHRLRLELTSSDAPYIDPHPNTGGTIALERRFRTARQTIYRSPSRPSRLLLPTVDATTLRQALVGPLRRDGSPVENH